NYQQAFAGGTLKRSNKKNAFRSIASFKYLKELWIARICYIVKCYCIHTLQSHKCNYFITHITKCNSFRFNAFIVATPVVINASGDDLFLDIIFAIEQQLAGITIPYAE